ncbi:hypothetical protein Enr17x_42040 [Gimesia fumaroli]|uniref:Uncharacterized protein n=1 Tax=Gimesia fumaroli TaxID=2527976 RepID=A0A518IGD4_9PLAN|nr:hypothetical protein Enr17x_42040 [Gimesia fumaroli]
MIEDPKAGEFVFKLTSSCFTYTVEIVEADTCTSLVKCEHGETWELNSELFRKDDFDGLAEELQRRRENINSELSGIGSRKTYSHMRV